MEMDYLRLPDSIKFNKTVTILMMNTNGLMLKYLPHQYKSDLDIVYAAVSQNESSIYYASDDIQQRVFSMNSGVEIRTRVAFLKSVKSINNYNQLNQ